MVSASPVSGRGLSAFEIEALRRTRNERYQRLLEEKAITIAGVHETLQVTIASLTFVFRPQRRLRW